MGRFTRTAQIGRTVTEIQRNIIRSGINEMRSLDVSTRRTTVAARMLDLDRILDVLNVRSVTSV